MGEGRWAIALGAVVLAQRAMFELQGSGRAAIARHESYHTRNAACLGECGYYPLYVTLGAVWARVRGAPWNGLAENGLGNPFERTAYALGREPEEIEIPPLG